MLQRIVLAVLLAAAVATAQQEAGPLLSSNLLVAKNNQLLLVAQNDPQAGFKGWMTLYQKAYHVAEEYARRFNIWKQNVERILTHNKQNRGYTLALNAYADLTWDEFASSRLGYKANSKAKAGKLQKPRSTFSHADVVAPASIDWRKTAVTHVKNQGQCGSCWAFSTTGAVEGINAIVTGQLTPLSEQELVDCDTKEDMGCSGGLMDNAFQYIVDNGGIDTEADYGYYSGYGFGTWCNKRKEKTRTAVTIDGYEDVPEGDEAALKKAVAKQPVAVAVCASSAMQFYHDGIITECCDELNHGVLAVGYGEEGGVPFWIVKNSWGQTWGEDGYFRLKYGGAPGGLCGIATAASYPLKTHPNPPIPAVCDPFAFQECATGGTCCCSFKFFGLFCLRHDCCPLEGGVCCGDTQHCCPGDKPVCDIEKGRCLSEDGKSSVEWTLKTKPLTSQPRDADAVYGLRKDPIVQDGMQRIRPF